MKCLHCGNDLPENAKFCTMCGAKIDAAMPPDVSARVNNHDHISSDRKSSSNANRSNDNTDNSSDNISGNNSQSINLSVYNNEEKSDSPAKSPAWKEQYTYILIGLVLVLAVVVGFVIRGQKNREKFGSQNEVMTNGIAENSTSSGQETYESESSNHEKGVYEEAVPENDETADGTGPGGSDEGEQENDAASDEKQETKIAETKKKSKSEKGDYVWPGSDRKYMKKSDLKGFSKRDCWLARNELYARHGRKFDNEELQRFFDSKKWYRGTIDPDDFKESELNKYEVHNRNLIVAFEKKKGYQ